MKKTQLFIFFIISLILSILCLGVGSIHIDSTIVFKSILSKFLNIPHTWNDMQDVIIYEVRFPRIVLGYITGGTLAFVGVLMQTLTRNNLAEPYILGISSGASAGAVSIIILGGDYLFLNYFTVGQGAFIGAFISILLVVGISYRSLNPMKLILIGVGISAFFMAITMFIIYGSTNNSQAISAMFWMTGSLASATNDIILTPLIITFILVIFTLFFSNEFDIMGQGLEFSYSVGLNILKLKIIIILISTILISTIVSLTGIIGFVGLIIPHMVKKFVGYKHINILPFSFVAGGLFLVIADTFARSVFSPEELPIGIVTAFCGSPIFLYIIKKDEITFKST